MTRIQGERDVLTYFVVRTCTCAVANVPVGKNTHSNSCSSNNDTWPVHCSSHTVGNRVLLTVKSQFSQK